MQNNQKFMENYANACKCRDNCKHFSILYPPQKGTQNTETVTILDDMGSTSVAPANSTAYVSTHMYLIIYIAPPEKAKCFKNLRKWKLPEPPTRNKKSPSNHGPTGHLSSSCF